MSGKNSLQRHGLLYEDFEKRKDMLQAFNRIQDPPVCIEARGQAQAGKPERSLFQSKTDIWDRQGNVGQNCFHFLILYVSILGASSLEINIQIIIN